MQESNIVEPKVGSYQYKCEQILKERNELRLEVGILEDKLDIANQRIASLEKDINDMRELLFD